MGCASCGASRVGRIPPTQRTQVNFSVVENCPYTGEQLNVWLTKLICCKDKVLYKNLGITAPTMNKYLGIVMSALNYPTNPCYFQKELDIISEFIILIVNSGIC
jgi:hypothetical protein